jgi:hypothetical protein
LCKAINCKASADIDKSATGDFSKEIHRDFDGYRFRVMSYQMAPPWVESETPLLVKPKAA